MMRILVTLLLLLVPILGVYTFVTADQHGWWFPINVSSFGGEIDQLFDLIMWMVGITFVITEGLLAWFVFKYSKARNDKAVYTHGNHKLEMLWTAVPAVLLLVIAFAQMGTWAEIRFQSHFPQGGRYSIERPIAELMASQFDWRASYPGADGHLGTADDVENAFELAVPADEQVVFLLRSRDVIHSFFVPEFRLKQDALPGHTIPVWFQAGLRPGDEAKGESVYDLVCAELCGWGHYKMAGRVRVLSRERYDAWLADLSGRWFDNGSKDAQ